MSTDRKPTRNVTLAELQLADIATITGQIDRLGKNLIEAMTQRDELLEALKGIMAIGSSDYPAEAKWHPEFDGISFSRGSQVWEQAERAIARAGGVTGRK